MKSPTSNFQVFALSPLLMLLFNASLQVFACDAPDDDTVMGIGIAGDQLIAIYNFSGIFCVYEHPAASALTNNKAYLGKSGKEAKKVWPELEMPIYIDAFGFITDLKGNHFLIIPEIHSPHVPRLAMKLTRFQNRSNLKGNVSRHVTVFDLDKKKMISKETQAQFPTRPVSTKEPMTMYDVSTPDFGVIYFFKRSFKGDNLSDASVKEDRYLLCPYPNSPNEKNVTQLMVTRDSKCNRNFPWEFDAICGFVDDKNIYLLGNGSVLSFEKDAVHEKLAQPVPLTFANLKNFLVKENAPEGGGGGGGDNGKSGKENNSFWMVVAIVVIVLILILIVVSVFCCCSTGKKGSKGHGSKKGSKKSAKKSKKGSSKLRSGRKSSKKMSSKKSSKSATSRMSKSKRFSKGGGLSKASSKKSSKR